MKCRLLSLCVVVSFCCLTNFAEAAVPKVWSAKVAGKGIYCSLVASKPTAGSMVAGAFVPDSKTLASLLAAANKVKSNAAKYKLAIANYNKLKQAMPSRNAACKKAMTSPPPSGGNAAAGQSLYAAKCLACHPVAHAKAGRSAAQILASTTNQPTMLAVKISSVDAANLAAYLATQ